jgi:hypothetical protein
MKTATRTLKRTITIHPARRKKTDDVESKDLRVESAAAPRVKVRMYRHGLGDCFLLTFPRTAGERPFYMLIDCGVVLGTADAAQIMMEVVEDIRSVTSDIDVLIVTHEHWDHNSGFVQAQSAFAKIKVHQIWLAWTEDPGNQLARKLKAERRNALRALRAAALRMRGATAGSETGVLSLLEFFGPVQGLTSPAMAAVGGTTEDAMKNAIALATNPPRYCHPVDPSFELEELPGIRFYVLGPPENEKRIKNLLPTKTGKETYDTALTLSPEAAFLVAAVSDRPADGNTELNDPDLQELARPFDKRWELGPAQAKKDKFFVEKYFGDESWRKIDTDWLDGAGQLALQLDSYTNNTSLVLAIELAASGEVLLFAADAQVGNWLSWNDQSWEIRDGDRVRNVTATDLLNRTVLYKVGHHGSHNATLRAKGLELMQSSALIALIPVDHNEAVKKRWNGMPFAALTERLEQKTSGRVLRSDDPEPPSQHQAPEGVPNTAWEDFLKNVTCQETTPGKYKVKYYEVSVKEPQPTCRAVEQPVQRRRGDSVSVA